MKKLLQTVVVSLLVLVTPSLVCASKAHRVRKNESIQTVAKKYHVSVADLKATNNLVNRRIKAGDRLVIPAGTGQDGSDVGKRKARYAKATYRVKRGDSLTRIARRTGVSVAELKRLNELGKGSVKPGRLLVLRAAEPTEESRPRLARRTPSRLNEIVSDQEYAASLAELADVDSDSPGLDLNASVNLHLDGVSRLKKSAYGFLGARYRFGGTSRNALDCSSFVQQVFRELQVSLPRTAREQFWVGNEVEPGNLQKGDLVFFRTYASFPSHVGIYLGDNRMIHASSRDRRVVISTMNTPYYRARYLGAKRISKINPSSFQLDDLMLGVEEELEDDVEQNDTLGIHALN